MNYLSILNLLTNLAKENTDLFSVYKDLKKKLNIATINCSKHESKIRCLLGTVIWK